MKFKELLNVFKDRFPFAEYKDYRPICHELFTDGKVGITLFFKNGDIIEYYPTIMEKKEETDENYLKKLAEKQTQIKELVPDSLKENEERRIEVDDYIQGDPDHNVQIALKRLKEVCWKNNPTIEDKKKFAKAQEIIISILAFGGYDIVRKEE